MIADGMAAELGAARPGPREHAWAHGVVGMVQTAGDWWLDARPCPRGELARQLTDLVHGAYGRLRAGGRLCAPGTPPALPRVHS